MKMQLAEIIKALSSSVNMGEDGVITSAVSDSRKATPNSLFIPLASVRDGRDSVPNAMANGAEATLWKKSHEGKPTDVSVIEVEDPLTALQSLAKYYLGKVNPIVVGITGSNGKTTTKDMVAVVLAKRSNAYKTRANFNNEIGVPVTILEMKPSTEILVLEMGMDRPGQLYHLSELVRPDVCVITMTGEAHTEFSGTRDKIADTKMEITDLLKEDDKFIYNGDEPLLEERAARIKQDKSTFGSREEDTVLATTFRSYIYHAILEVNDSEQRSRIPMIGKHNVSNALTIISVGRHSGENDEQIAQALANFTLTANRMQRRKGDVGEAIMDGVYNLNPAAIKVVITPFGQVTIQDGGRRTAVLGDMLELGDESAEFHASLANALDPAIINELYLHGPEMKNLYDAFVDKYSAANLHYYPQDEMNHMIDDLKNGIEPADIVMLKGSHGMYLEKVLDRLI